MVEAFVAFGVFGSFPPREHDDELVGYADRVDHFVVGVAGVYVSSVEGNFCNGGVEVFKFEFADFAAVHCIGPVGAETFDVEFVGALSDFLVGVEGDSDVTVLDFGMSLEESDCGDYFGDSGFVVGAEESVTVGDDEVLSDVVIEFGEVGRRKGYAEVVV